MQASDLIDSVQWFVTAPVEAVSIVIKGSPKTRPSTAIAAHLVCAEIFAHYSASGRKDFIELMGPDESSWRKQNAYYLTLLPHSAKDTPFLRDAAVFACTTILGAENEIDRNP